MPTIGVSIAVPEPWGSQLQDYRAALGDPTASQIPTHITLVPPYDAEDDDREPVFAHLADIARTSEPFRIHLRGTGTFRPVSPVVFVGVVEGISECEQLSRRLRRGPLAVEVAFPYHPHVTVAHHLEDAVLDRAFTELGDYDAVFDVTGYWLYVHDETVGWQPRREFVLGGQSEPPG